MVRETGLGAANYRLAVYIANRPPLAEYQALNRMRVLQTGEIDFIVSQTGNHWRKIFNLYAKLVFALEPRQFSCWQEYRDNYLLGPAAEHALLFSPPRLGDEQKIHIITGKTYAAQLGLDVGLQQVDSDFARDRSHRLIVAPYFDYRQLSNAKLSRLVNLIQALA